MVRLWKNVGDSVADITHAEKEGGFLSSVVLSGELKTMKNLLNEV